MFFLLELKFYQFLVIPTETPTLLASPSSVDSEKRPCGVMEYFASTGFTQ